jgi:RNA ligase (TIGR02306 family)
MSEFHVVVTQLEKIGRHPNADTLEISTVCGYPVIFKENQFKPGDKVVYVPVDALVPLWHPLFAWLDEGNIGQEYIRIKAKKLRGINSVGLLARAHPDWEVGRNVQAELCIKKYEPNIPAQMSGEAESGPSVVPVFTDMESLRKFPDVIKEGESVIISEKIHGSNARFYWHDGRLWCGSHYQWKKDDPNNMYWKAARKYGLDKWCEANPDLVLYGEVYGHQKGFQYAVDRTKGDVGFCAFDVYDTFKGSYWSAITVFGVMEMVAHIPFSPVIYDGPWKQELTELRFGPSLVKNAKNIREGFVVRPTLEKYDPTIGRVVLKMVSEDYWVARGNKE